MVEQVIDRIRVVVLTKFFHDRSLDVGTSQSSALCIIGFIFYILAQLLSLLGSLEWWSSSSWLFFAVLSSLLKEMSEPTY